jgi:hypothetical protein
MKFFWGRVGGEGCRNLSLGFTTKVKACKREARELDFMFPGVQKNVRK